VQRILPQLAVGALGLGTLLTLNTRAPGGIEGEPKVEHGLPGATSGYVGSGACQSCHPSAYRSWHDSFHRTMTRPVRDLAWDGEHAPRLPITLEGDQGNYTLSRSDDGSIDARGPDLHAPDRKVVERKLVLATGSHHYLAFWLTGPVGRELRQFPFVFLLGEKTWAPRREVFLAPPHETDNPPSWNANCIQCHAVAGEPRQSEGASPESWVRYESQVAELGIACEACHGPGGNHAARMRAPWERERAHRQPREGPDDPNAPELEIVNPARLTAAQSSAICGQCHAYFLPVRPDEWWSHGYTKRSAPAVDLADSRSLLAAASAELAERAALSHELTSIFWSDGSVRVGGREYNGLLQSPCFEHGTGQRQLSCASCHGMHQGKPDDQLRPDLSRRQLCSQCHQEVASDADHSGHAPSVNAPDCVDCHMPKTSYALLKGIASHRISSPGRKLTDPPSACALCHVDRSAAWLDAALVRLFPDLRPAPPGAGPATTETATPDEPDVALGARQLLAGNAAERALFASALADPGARSLVDSAWSIRLLDRLADDPYPAVRRIARRAEREIRAQPKAARPASALPNELLDALEEARDDRAIVISE